MTRSSDCGGDMRAEDVSDDPFLTDLLEELRSWGEGTAPAPTPALVALFDAAPAAPAGPAPGPRRNKKMLTAKLAGLGVAAKAALGIGIAAAAVTTAGAGGVLPAPAQHAVASVVGTITPLQLPDPTVKATVDVTTKAPEAGDDQGDDSPTTTVAGTTPTTTGTHDGGSGTGAIDNHGACVSAVAHDDSVQGKDHGKLVSAAARSDCGKESSTSTTTPATTTPSTTTPSTTTPTTTALTGRSGPSANSGYGSGNSGKGNGNGGSGK